MNTFTILYEAQSPKQASTETPTKSKKTKHPSSKKKKRKSRSGSPTKIAVGGGEIDSLENFTTTRIASSPNDGERMKRTKKKSSTKSRGHSDRDLKDKKKKTKKQKQTTGSKKSKRQNHLQCDAALVRSNLEKCRLWWVDEAEQPQMTRRGPCRSGDRVVHRRYSQYKEDEDLSIDLSKLMDMLSN